VRRRDFLQLSAAGSALLAAPPWLLGCENRRSGSAGGSGLFRSDGSVDPLAVALASWAWLHSNAVESRGGFTWPVVPGESASAAINLYSGTPGIVLFLLELHHATGESSYLQEAADAAYLLQGAYTEGGGWPAAAGTAPDDPAILDPGLYTGQAGAAFTLLETYKATDNELHLHGTAALLEAILATAQPVGNGVAWFRDTPEDASYDIISGSAGIGLTLLYAHQFFEDPDTLGCATDTGRYLLDRGRRADVGLKWPMSESQARLMPNFSHGTAGVSYFLARLAQITGENAFMDGALQGAEYLKSVARCTDQGCLIFHHEPGGEDLFYLGWCHGPPGTARLFFELSRATGDRHWMDWARRGAEGIRGLGFPEERTDGAWNNVGQCCGDAGIGDFFLALGKASGDPGYGEFARRLGAYAAGKGEEAEEGAEWPHAEHRTMPDLIQAQTGWMQGAAGIGAFFLHLDGAEKGRGARIVFPDSPWTGLI